MAEPKSARLNIGEPIEEYAARRLKELADDTPSPEVSVMIWGGGGGGMQSTAPTFVAPLTNSIVPTVATGSPTFTRATAATVVDFEGIVRNCLSGEARFQEARRVRNVALSTENPASSWTASSAGLGSAPTLTVNFAAAPDGTQTAHRLQCALNGGNSSGAHQSFLGCNVAPVYTTGRQSVYLRTNDNSSSKTLTLRGAAYTSTVHSVTIDSVWRRYSVLDTVAASTGANVLAIGLRGDGGQVCSDSIDVLFWHPQLEDVTGQANQAPSEYVSVGVLSAPFQGANVDGVQYFASQNGNLWNSTTKQVQEWPGAALTPDGYLAEAQAQNIVLQSQNYGSTWTLNDLTILSSTNTAPDGSATAFLLQAGSAGTEGTFQNMSTSALSTYAVSTYFKVSTNAWVAMRWGDGTNQIQGWWNISTGVTGSSIAVGTASSAANSIQALANGWFRCTLTGAPNHTTATAGVNIFCTNGNGSLTRVTSSTRFQWGSQIETNGSVNAFATSYISTGAAAVTRNADQLSYVGPGNVSNLQGTVYAELQTQWALNPAVITPIAIALDSNGRPMFVSGVSNPATQLNMFDGTSIPARTGLSDMSTGVRKRGSSWGPAGMSMTGDGATVSTFTFDGTMGANSFSTLSIGALGGNVWMGTLRNVTIWPYQFSNAQLQQQTT